MAERQSLNVSLRSLLRWVPQFLEFRQTRLRSQFRLLSLAALVGVVAGLGAIVDAAIAAYHLRQGEIRPRVPLVKIVASALTIGSGGSGGVFGPSMVIGGCGGGALGIVLHRLWPGLVPDPAAYVIVGMAGFFAGAANTPFSTLVIVSEMTGGYHLLLPGLWSSSWRTISWPCQLSTISRN